MKLPISIALFLLLFYGLSCTNYNQEPAKSTIAPINPNGDSELALLMREMFDDALRMKQQVEKGEAPNVDVLAKFAAIHTAQATEPEKANSEKFKAFANSYLLTLEALQKASASEASSLYLNVVESCMSCHRAMCPGPMVRIKKLYVKK